MHHVNSNSMTAYTYNTLHNDVAQRKRRAKTSAERVHCTVRVSSIYHKEHVNPRLELDIDC